MTPTVHPADVLRLLNGGPIRPSVLTPALYRAAAARIDQRLASGWLFEQGEEHAREQRDKLLALAARETQP